MSRTRLVWPALIVVLALGAFWRAGRAGWPLLTGIPPAAPEPARPGGPRVPSGRRVVAEGRVVCYPGAEVVVCAEIGGTILRLPVRERDAVRRGDLIAELRADDLRAARAEAVARIGEMEAELRYFDRKVRRAERLVARRAGTFSDLDDDRHGLEVARARRESAIAARDRYDALIAKTRLVAPIDGVILARHVHPGETIEPATRVVTVADLSRVRVEAEVDEYDTGLVSLGDPATIRAEGYDRRSWHGTVEEIPDAVVARRLQPEDPGRPTDTRVLLVKIAFDTPTPLKLGRRVLIEFRPVAGAEAGREYTPSGRRDVGGHARLPEPRGRPSSASGE